MPLWMTSRPSPSRAIVMTRFNDRRGSEPCTQRKFSASRSRGPWGRTFQSSAGGAIDGSIYPLREPI